MFQGSVDDKNFMEKTLRDNNIHVVISAVGGESILDQLCLIDAIQAAGTVKVRVTQRVLLLLFCMDKGVMHGL